MRSKQKSEMFNVTENFVCIALTEIKIKCIFQSTQFTCCL